MQAQPRSFLRFASNLYCSGSEERLCALPDGNRAPPGHCFWFKPQGRTWAPVSTEDMELGQKPRWPRDRWDPARAGAIPTTLFPPPTLESASRCVRGKRVHVIGDSTTRDTFYELLASTGREVTKDGSPADRRRIWPTGAWEPSFPRSGGGDALGRCMGHGKRHVTCIRDVREREAGAESETRFSFQFLSGANNSWELDESRRLLADRPPDVLFVQAYPA